MCGVYGIFRTDGLLDQADVCRLAKLAEARGVDSAGIIYQSSSDISIIKRDFGSVELIKKNPDYQKSKFIAGHSRLVTNDVLSNQPVIKDDLLVFHNGIITNYKKIWGSIGQLPKTKLDSEIIPVLFRLFKDDGLSDDTAVDEIFRICEGVISAILIEPSSLAL